MFHIEKKTSLTAAWVVHYSANTEAIAIACAQHLSAQFPQVFVRVVTAQGNLVYQA